MFLFVSKQATLQRQKVVFIQLLLVLWLNVGRQRVALHLVEIISGVVSLILTTSLIPSKVCQEGNIKNDFNPESAQAPFATKMMTSYDADDDNGGTRLVLVCELHFCKTMEVVALAQWSNYLMTA